MNEIEWRDVPGYPGYEASTFGSIVGFKGQLKPCLNRKTGYLQLRLYCHGVPTTLTVHQVIAMTFLGPCPPGKEVLHGPLGKQFNGVKNLRYGTRSENMTQYWEEKHGQY